ncbi:hypothetical protein ON010_g11716 [Phytophthora cinnamomi]|nr:hypothetical protein ON010_g11716 [Phytophthora cinnamomi]
MKATTEAKLSKAKQLTVLKKKLVWGHVSISYEEQHTNYTLPTAPNASLTLIIAGVPGDLEALAGRLAQVHHKQSEHHAHEDHDGAEDEHGCAASVAGRVRDCRSVVAVVGLDGRATGGDGRRDATDHELGQHDNQAHDERLGVGGDAEAVSDLRHRDARATRDHEAVRHQVRETVPKTDLPMTPCQSVLALEILGRLSRCCMVLVPVRNLRRLGRCLGAHRLAHLAAVVDEVTC